MSDTPPLLKVPSLQIIARAAARLGTGHPWIYANDIQNLDTLKLRQPGEIAQIVDPKGNITATGYSNRHSLIAFRALVHGPAMIDEAFYEGRLRAALARRTQFAKPYYRLVHAEGDGLPGLVIDRFDTLFSVQLNSAGADRHADKIAAALDKIFPGCSLLLRRDAYSRGHENLPVIETPEIIGKVLPYVSVWQNNIEYIADLKDGQKTGWYYDQTANHALIARYAKGKSMLDLCTHAGGFALAAAKAGASEIVAVDSSAPALELAEKAAEKAGAKITFEKADMFDYLTETERTFDIVVADPPPFVRSKKDIESGARGYRKLAKLSGARVAPGGILAIASCSHNMPRDRFALEVAAGLAAAGRTGRILYDTGAGADHPVHLALPESAYLKMLTIQLD